MDWHFEYTPDLWPLLGTMAFLAVLGAFSWSRRSVRGAAYFALGCLFSALWLAGAAAETAGATEQAKVAWYRFQVVWPLPTVAAMACFTLDYVWPGRWLSRRNLFLLFIPSIASLLFIVTNDRLHLHWSGFIVEEHVRGVLAAPAWILVGYGMGLVLINITAFVWLFFRSPPHRWPAALIIAGQIMGRGAFVPQLITVKPWLPINPLIPAFLLPYGIYAIALFGFRLFDPLPAAQRTVIRQLREGVLVFDLDWRVANLNPAAERMLGVRERQALRKTLPELLPELAGWQPNQAAAEESFSEITRDQDGRTRYWALTLSPLKGHQGATIGRLLLLRDVTEGREAQAQIMQQQAALAALRERDLLARELHDGLGQVLGYAKLQAQAARDLLAQHRSAEADAHLAQLVAVVQGAHADVHDYVLGTRATQPIEHGLRASLQQHLEHLKRDYQIQAELEIAPGVSDELFEPAAAVQLVRIVQETLANARKHAHASCLRVCLAVHDGAAEVSIEDDGHGFDACAAEGKGFGLRFMRERAQEVGGSLEVHSAPGQGTAVIVRVPVRKDSGP